MAAAVKYFDTAKLAHCRLTAGVANTDGTGSLGSFTWYNTAPTDDWMLTKIIFSSTSATGVGDTADSLVNLFLDDGSTPRLFRTIDLGNAVAGSVSVGALQYEVLFGPEFIFPTTISVKATISVTPTAGNLDLLLIAQAA